MNGDPRHLNFKALELYRIADDKSLRVVNTESPNIKQGRQTTRAD